MGWFDEQIKYRKKVDNENFTDAIEDIAGAVMGKRLSAALDKKEIANSAIEEILRFYHYKVKNDELPAAVKTVDEQLEYRLRPFGIMRRTVKLDKGWYKYACGPMLGTLKENGAAVALIPRELKGYWYIDIETGKKIGINRKNEDILDTEAICFYKPLPTRSLTILDLLKYMLEQLNVYDVVMYIGMMGVSTALGLLMPMLTKWLFGEVLRSGSYQALFAIACFMLGYSVCSALMSAFQALINSSVTIKQDIAVQAAVMNRILSMPAAFFKEYTAGELSQRSMYVNSLCSTLVNSIGTTSITALFSLVYIGQISGYTPALAGASLIIMVVTAALSIVTTLAQMRITKEKMLLSSKTSGITYSTITGIQKIKLAGAEKRMFSRWARQYAREATMEYNPPTFIKLRATLSLAISLIGSMILYAIAVKAGVSIADYYAFNTSYAMVSSAFMSVTGIALSIANIKPSLEMAKPILETAPEISEGREIVTSLRGGIEVSNVSFRYDDAGPNVIDNLSLKIKSGEYVAIVGSTGCGKSTLLRLLLGFETPQKGAIYYDGKDVSRLDLKSLRRHIGVVMQDGRLFSGSIFSNITIAAPQLTLDGAWEAAKIASVDEDIEAMPMGMHTFICEGQGGISGGQKQRLMIARAVAGKPKILMFDEATSALDNVTQKKVSKAIDDLHCTRIVIAHRLSTIRHCDRIIVLNGGKIVEDGTYEELLDMNGFFAELVARQRLDVEEPQAKEAVEA